MARKTGFGPRELAMVSLGFKAATKVVQSMTVTLNEDPDGFPGSKETWRAVIGCFLSMVDVMEKEEPGFIQMLHDKGFITEVDSEQEAEEFLREHEGAETLNVNIAMEKPKIEA